MKVILQATKTRFGAAMQAVANAENVKREKVRQEYAATLERVLKQVAATGDLDASLQVKSEKERIEKGQDATEA